MRRICDGRRLGLIAAVVCGILIGRPGAGNLLAQTAGQSSAAGLPSETPAKLEPATSSFDYVRRDVMSPMRGGVKPHTGILGPEGAKGAASFVTRTACVADAL